MSSYDEELKNFQAQALANLQQELNKPDPDPLRVERQAFLRQLVDCRLKKKLSQTELAEKLGMQQPNLARIEAGKGNPTLHTLLAIAKALDATLMLEYKQ